MDQNFCIRLCILCASQSVMAFNIDPVSWKTFTAPSPSQSQNVAFGYKVIQKDASSLLVSDPLIQHHQTQRGQIYRCAVTEGNCTPLSITVTNEAVNMSLGLSMSLDPQSSTAVVCGPTIPKTCDVTTTYNGMCFKISPDNVVSRSVPETLRECPSSQIDIAFLMDGSGSVNYPDFIKMKAFVIEMIKSFVYRDTQFAIAQFSTECVIHYKFQQVQNAMAWEDAVNKISQQRGWTYTAKAIRHLVDELFVSSGGVRPSATKILVVITDGESTDSKLLTEAVQHAQAKHITRYAIGVGDAFDNDEAIRELAIIASLPTNRHVFKVTNFDALESIREKLKENIIAIEGTQTSGDSSRMEFAQDGFSAAFTSNTDMIMTAVGAFQWKGGYQLYKNDISDQSFKPNSVFQAGSEHDSYLGYSLTIATMSRAKYAVMGAPRHKHKGQVTVSRIDRSDLKQLDSPKPQIGSYFGAEVCVVDLNSDSYTDLLLVSAPTYTESDREGLVFVYIITRRANFIFSDTLVGMAGQRGRFGSSLASPADLNGDGFRDVLVGAPLEEDGLGSIYIFNGIDGGVISKYSQRIAGSSVQPGLRFFGISLSQSSLDQTRDRLPDIAVGSKGAVLLLRSRPIMLLETKVTYNPTKIPTSETDQSLENTMKVCFTMRQYRHSIRDLSAKINYTITLDAKRQKYRANFSPKTRILSNVVNIDLKAETCRSHRFFIDAFSEDALNPLSNQLTFTFEGLPLARLQNIKPVLLPTIKTTTDHSLDFEINCGHDDICIDDLRMDFNFSGFTNIEVGIMQELNVTVFVENRGENSYNTLFTLSYPFGLSYRRFTSKQGRVECVSLDAERGVTLGETSCQISKPILKGNTQAVFHITYSIDKESTFDQSVTFTAKINSGNDQHSKTSQFLKRKSIGVKFAIYIALIRHEDSSLHINFTAQKPDLERPVKQILKVENDFRELNFKVFIKVPVILGDKFIWTDKNLQIPDCVKQRDERPLFTNFVEVFKKDRVLNCSVAVCAVFSCDVTLIKNERKLYNIFGNVSSGWIEQTGLKAAVFELVSSASLDYDKSKYIFFSSDSQHTAPSVQINTQVEVFEEVNLTKEIIGGVIGGLLLLALITAALYKAGFFKSQYKQMIENAEQSAEEGPTTEK
ncbi:integrin alpha-X-like [Rhinichthys klamathensis goyatoka]|uniref:integrin alpha-X-like n=1 Tax=Rhinichthys klamathensis goyatoka TaxID=3034132 RepID=UPI0024B4A62C|nr:integrin alpha-X-like [Rhinichthys klamathensis goyatoka]